MEYYSPFRGPEAIFLVYEPQGVLTCWSATLVVLADSGPFHGLLLTVLGSLIELQGALTCRSSTIIVLADSGPFLELLLSFGVTESFP